MAPQEARGRHAEGGEGGEGEHRPEAPPASGEGRRRGTEERRRLHALFRELRERDRGEREPGGDALLRAKELAPLQRQDVVAGGAEDDAGPEPQEARARRG